MEKIEQKNKQTTDDLYAPYKNVDELVNILKTVNYQDKGIDNIQLQIVKSMNKIVEKLDLLNSNLQEIHKIMKRKDWE